jgi:uncharacterized membrane protein affecting hemolysin expression
MFNISMFVEKIKSVKSKPIIMVISVLILSMILAGVVVIRSLHDTLQQEQLPNGASVGITGPPKLSAQNDNRSLDSDLTTVHKQLDQSAQDISSADAAMNDQPNQINVPEN